MAERELLAAAKVIEAAAAQLLNAKNAKKAQPPPPSGQLDVTGPIVDAASAIAEAAARLVKAATEAQKERIAHGLTPNSENPYKRDPAWTEGLISAAKYVAMATQQLAHAANDCVQGKVLCHIRLREV